MFDCRFTYPSGSSWMKDMTSVLTYAEADRIIALLDAAGVPSPYDSERGHYYDGRYRDGARLWLGVPEVVEMVRDLPMTWTCDVYSLQTFRSKEKMRAERVASYEAQPHGGIRAYLAGLDPDGHGMKKAEPHDMSWICQLARADHRKTARSTRTGKLETYGKGPYEPVEGGRAKLRLKEGVSFSYIQDSYADYTRVAVPAELEAGADRDVCRRNLQRLTEALRTHTGFAGSGSTWSAELVEHEAGAFVIFGGRHSISD